MQTPRSDDRRPLIARPGSPGLGNSRRSGRGRSGRELMFWGVLATMMVPIQATIPVFLFAQ